LPTGKIDKGREVDSRAGYSLRRKREASGGFTRARERGVTPPRWGQNGGTKKKEGREFLAKK